MTNLRLAARRARLPALTKPESRHGRAGIAMRLLLLMSREPMQQPLPHRRAATKQEPCRGLSGVPGVRREDQAESWIKRR